MSSQSGWLHQDEAYAKIMEITCYSSNLPTSDNELCSSWVYSRISVLEEDRQGDTKDSNEMVI